VKRKKKPILPLKKQQLTDDAKVSQTLINKKEI